MLRICVYLASTHRPSKYFQFARRAGRTRFFNHNDAFGRKARVPRISVPADAGAWAHAHADDYSLRDMAAWESTQPAVVAANMVRPGRTPSPGEHY